MRYTRNPQALYPVSPLTGLTLNCLSDECLGRDITCADDGLASGAWTANLLIFVPLISTRPMVVSQFFWQNGATVDGSSHTDVCIYNEDGSAKVGNGTGSTVN